MMTTTVNTKGKRKRRNETRSVGGEVNLEREEEEVDDDDEEEKKKKTEEMRKDLYLRISEEEEGCKGIVYWKEREARLWFWALFIGTSCLYAARTTIPLVAPSLSSEFRWSKTETGAVLSSFFWGYALTQVLGGYLSDRFGAERVLLASVLIWGFFTLWFTEILRLSGVFGFPFLIFIRILLGAAQGVYLPSLASLVSRRIKPDQRSFFFSSMSSGSTLGVLFMGSFGSLVLNYYGWPFVFYLTGFIILSWALALKYHCMDKIGIQRVTVLGVSSNSELSTIVNDVPWLAYFKSSSLWACVFAHLCQTNCFFILLSWLPTYFHDNYPSKPEWVYNTFPWLFAIPGVYIANIMSKHLLSSGMSTSKTRKTMVSLCFLCQSLGLLRISNFTTNFEMAIACLSLCLFGSGMHSSSVFINPGDLAPKHTGSVFGIMNAAGAIPGFVGVYISGYILEIFSGSWGMVFNFTVFVNFLGFVVFIIFGSAKPIL